MRWLPVISALLRGWPGRRCPECKSKPGRKHHYWCSIGKWDGGRWA